MHYDDPSLLAAIRERPDDNDLRLVYSDWLEDHGQPERAEFVRLQCANPIEISPLGNPIPDSGNIWYSFPAAGLNANADLARQFELYRKYVRKWNGAIHRRLRGTPLQHHVGSRGGILRGWSYRRGFPTSLWARADVFNEHPESLLLIGPIERLIIVGDPQHHELIRLAQTLERHPLRFVQVIVRGGGPPPPPPFVSDYSGSGSWLSRLASFFLRR